MVIAIRLPHLLHRFRQLHEVALQYGMHRRPVKPLDVPRGLEPLHVLFPPAAVRADLSRTRGPAVS